MNILFVCTGNTCRSPMAEGYLHSLGIKDISVKSRGLCADGSAVSQNALLAMREAGIDISSHISRQITPEDITWADKIICMSASHISALTGICKAKLSLLGAGICDPFGGSLQNYRTCRDQIIKQLEAMFLGFSVIPLEERHIKQIARLEKICFSSPWSENAIADSHKAGTRFFVAESGDEVLGYAGLSAVIDEGYITNVAVFPHHRKKGVAHAVLNAMFCFARQNSLNFISLEVRPSNNEAVSLYKNMGFTQEGLRKGFYQNPKEDALILTKRFD